MWISLMTGEKAESYLFIYLEKQNYVYYHNCPSLFEYSYLCLNSIFDV